MPAQETLDLLARLVAYNTETQRSNLDLIGFVEDYLHGLGVATTRAPNADGTKSALFATIGPTDSGGIVLSGHTDVVPVEGQTWSSDPYTLRIDGDRAYGRGAVDMKGFIALALAAVPAFQRARLKTPIHLMFSYDEETTCLGVVDMIARFGRDLPMPAAVIVGEPTELEVADAHKSVVVMETVVHGFEAHSSKPDLGANAILGATMLIGELERIGETLRARGDVLGRFDPPYTSVHVGTIRGGTARNIIPKQCRFDWEFRGLPGLDEAEIPALLDAYAREIVLPRLTRSGVDARIETTRHVAVPGLAPMTGSAAETLALRLAARNRTSTVPFGTEAGHFQRAGIPTIVCGPGSIDQAHQPDEYITLAALDDGERFMADLAAELS